MAQTGFEQYVVLLNMAKLENECSKVIKPLMGFTGNSLSYLATEFIDLPLYDRKIVLPKKVADCNNEFRERAWEFGIADLKFFYDEKNQLSYFFDPAVSNRVKAARLGRL